MLALVDYPSDGDSSDAADNKPKQQTVIIPSATTQMQPHAAVLSAPQPKPALPDAASLFSSSTDSRFLSFLVYNMATWQKCK